MIIISSEGLTCKFIGETNEVPEKRNYIKHETIYGQEADSHVRRAVNITVKILTIDQDNYDKLELIFFLYNDSISITDTATGQIFNKMYIDGETLNLEKKKDYKRDDYVRSGTLNVRRR